MRSKSVSSIPQGSCLTFSQRDGDLEVPDETDPPLQNQVAFGHGFHYSNREAT